MLKKTWQKKLIGIAMRSDLFEQTVLIQFAKSPLSDYLFHLTKESKCTVQDVQSLLSFYVYKNPPSKTDKKQTEIYLSMYAHAVYRAVIQPQIN
ncbi:hypothetical protein AWM68_17850 [Fictibacillus phosphorivorans]|uniref:Uncharacterized protein n=1 Tax=Fictibacillus phosphorivorans TaxID=1221500 RepID=A0A163S337_9BACL|nr:hypothetical protein [Fictibacillus phosphorivorans]KZE68034.1 hypothetical protein AWM68_17850 [Fictibacillus phosphorivorans]